MAPFLLHFVAEEREYVAVRESVVSSISAAEPAVLLCSEKLRPDWGRSTTYCSFYKKLTDFLGTKTHRYRAVLSDSDFDSIEPAREFLTKIAYYRSPNYQDLPRLD